MNSIFSSIITGFKDQTRAEIVKWRSALALAQNPINPRICQLQDLYDNLEADGHYIAQRNLRKAATSSYAFSIVDRKTGEINEEKTAFFQSEWFFDFLDSALDSIFKGFTLIELTDPKKLTFATIPRRHIVPTLGIVVKEVYDQTGINFTKGFEHTRPRLDGRHLRSTYLETQRPTVVGRVYRAFWYAVNICHYQQNLSCRYSAIR